MDDETREKIRGYLAGEGEGAAGFLAEIIPLRSVAGEGEAEIMEWLASRLAGDLDARVEAVPVPESITDDPEYTFFETERDYSGRPNLIITRPGSGSGHSATLNTHADVVPAANWPDAWEPRREGDYVYGRGTCDAKGQIAAMVWALKALDAAGVETRGDVILQIVIEEEIGGNGSLAAIRGGHTKEVAVVGEPTSLLTYPAGRGAFWWRLAVEGRPTHSGSSEKGVSAVDLQVEAVGILKSYWVELKARCRNTPLYDPENPPVPFNIGVVRGGDWPATVPKLVEMEGMYGFTHKVKMRDVIAEVGEALRTRGSPWLREHFEFTNKGIHNEAFASDVDHPAVAAFAEAVESIGLDPTLRGWSASSDARLFGIHAAVPTITFGPGDLIDAHSDHERVRIPDVLKAAEAIALFLADWTNRPL